MKAKGRKLLHRAAGVITFAAIAGNTCVTAAAANQIGQIDTAGLLNIHAAASDSSEILGQVMDEGHVAVLDQADGWVCIMAGEIIGWVPQENLIETEVSWEDAHEANQKVIAEITEEIEEILETQEAGEDGTEPEEDSKEAPETEEVSETGESAQPEGKASEPESTSKNAVSQPAEELPESETPGSAEALPESVVSGSAEVLPESTVPQDVPAPVVLTEAAQAADCENQLQAAAVAPVWEVENISPEDIELLANIIYCEAGAEPYVGKVAVGNVVVNRVKSERYPATIRDVIYEKGQFSPVRSGRLEKALRNSSADVFCYQAAVEALAGSRPVADLLHFRRVNGKAGLVIGNHVFY